MNVSGQALGFLNLVAGEGVAAQSVQKQFSSFHEAYAVILEEVDELWDEVKKRNHNPHLILRELTQIAAMCMRTADELIPPAVFQERAAELRAAKAQIGGS